MSKNMFTSNEPGYYENDEFGVRIENVLQVVQIPDSSKHFGGRGAYKFEDVTMVPIQTKLIDTSLLTNSEVYTIVFLFPHLKLDDILSIL